MTLHIVSNPDAIDQCLKIAIKGDVLLLTLECAHQKRVMANIALKESAFPVFWLVERRDNNQVYAENEIDYSGFVSLCETHNPIQSWY